MSKQYNTRENFEDVYLRSKCLARALSRLPNGAAEKFLKDPEFNRCVSFMANNVFTRNMSKLQSCGFDEEDIKSISLVYGLEFMATNSGISADTRPSRDTYLIMFRFLGQKWINFFIRLDIKFFNDERLAEPHIGKLPVSADNLRAYDPMQSLFIDENLVGKEDQNLANFIEGSSEPLDSFSYQEQLSVLKEQLESVDLQRSSLTKKACKNMEKEVVSRLKQRLLYQQRSLGKKISTIKKRISEERRILKGLKDEIKNNSDKYAERLAFLATSKHTSFAVRKNAQKLCRKHAINYVIWAKDYIQERDVNPDNFISLK